MRRMSHPYLQVSVCTTGERTLNTTKHVTAIIWSAFITNTNKVSTSTAAEAQSCVRIVFDAESDIQVGAYEMGEALRVTGEASRFSCLGSCVRNLFYLPSPEVFLVMTLST